MNKDMVSTSMNTHPTTTSLHIPPVRDCIEPSKLFAQSFAKQMQLTNSLQERVTKSVDSMLAILINNSMEDSSQNQLSMEISLTPKSLKLCFKNIGCPLLLCEGDVDSSSPNPFDDSILSLSDDFSYENNGRQGQSFTFLFSLAPNRASPFLPKEPVYKGIEDFKIRLLNDGEEAALSRLFHKVYGYNYIQEYVYFPEKLRSMIMSKDLIPIVAVGTDNNLIGHIGLVRKNQNPLVYEAALGIVDPQIKALGTFKKLFSEVMNHTHLLKMNYCIFDFVTNLDFTQKEVFRYGCHPLSLHLGCQISETQAKLKTLGIGTDPNDMDRYSILLAVKTFDHFSFDHTVTLPVHLGEMLGFLLEPIGIDWVPTSRFIPLPTAGQYHCEVLSTQKSVIFYFDSPGLKGLEKILAEWKYLLRRGYLYGAVDIPLNKPGVGQVYNMLTKNGFFIAGFVPYQNEGHLALRLQSLGPTRVSSENIKLSSPASVRLLEIICEQYERNCKL